MSREPILIVGAGPVGVISAILLARRGIESVVVERYTKPYGLPRAVHIDDEVFRILQEVGVADRFQGVSRPMPGMRLLDADYRTMAEFPRSTTPGVNGYAQGTFFDQPDLEALLMAEVATLPQVTIRTGVELVTFSQSATGVTAVLRDVESGIEEELSAPALLGCDGANSRVRDVIGSSLVDLGYEERWCVVDVRSPRPLPVWDGMYQVCDPARATTFGQIMPGRYRWEFHLAAGEDVDDVLQPTTLAALARPVLGDVPFTELEVIRSAEYTFRARVADSWRSGRVFLVGDAAHLTPPFVGQGLCAGIRDAQNLAWKLALVLDRGADESLLDTYESERKPHARRFIQLAKMVGFAMTGGQDRAATARKGLLAFLTRVPGFSAAVLSQTAPALEDGLLAPRGRLGRSPVGRLLPQPWVRVDGRQCRLDDVLGPGFAIVTSQVPTWDQAYLARRLDARLVVIADGSARSPLPHGAVAVEDIDAILRSWLRTHDVAAAIVRPDRIVASVERSAARTSYDWLRIAEPRVPSVA